MGHGFPGAREWLTEQFWYSFVMPLLGVAILIDMVVTICRERTLIQERDEILRRLEAGQADERPNGYA